VYEGTINQSAVWAVRLVQRSSADVIYTSEESGLPKPFKAAVVRLAHAVGS
jgi:hypothetical protein